MNLRNVEKILQSVLETDNATEETWIINGTELGNQDPFVKFEEFTVKKPGIFLDHPHRGIDSVTYIWEGVTVDEDCFGNTGQLEPGDVQWLTTGRGVVHARAPISEEPVVGLQLWLNLPRKDKMADPMSQEIRASEIPKYHEGGVSVAVISGETLGHKSKVSTKTPVLYLDLTLQPGTQHIQPVPPTPEQQVAPHHAVLFSDGDCVKAENQGPEVCRFVLVAGEPTGEPVIHRGQFVMTTEEEITQAIQDYESCTNGFERALHWKSKISELVKI